MSSRLLLILSLVVLIVLFYLVLSRVHVAFPFGEGQIGNRAEQDRFNNKRRPTYAHQLQARNQGL